jgi:hypothetical protein
LMYYYCIRRVPEGRCKHSLSLYTSHNTPHARILEEQNCWTDPCTDVALSCTPTTSNVHTPASPHRETEPRYHVFLYTNPPSPHSFPVSLSQDYPPIRHEHLSTHQSPTILSSITNTTRCRKHTEPSSTQSTLFTIMRKIDIKSIYNGHLFPANPWQRRSLKKYTSPL